jgi:hypothetical protein
MFFYNKMPLDGVFCLSQSDFFLKLLYVNGLKSRGGQPFWQVGQIQEQKSSEGQNLVKRGLGGPNFSLLKANCKLFYTNIFCLVDLISPRGPFQNPRRAKNGPRAPRWPPLG